MDWHSKLLYAIPNLLEFFSGKDAFIAEIISTATETKALVQKIIPATNETKTLLQKIIPTTNITQNPVQKATLREIKARWIGITSSKHFFMPGSHRSELKSACLLVSIDIANLDLSPSEDSLSTIVLMLDKIIKKSERLLHGDPIHLVNPAVQSTYRFLESLENSHQVGDYPENERHDPINLWTECRRLSKNTDERIYQYSNAILKLCKLVVSAYHQQIEVDEEIKELKEEIKAVRHYLRKRKLVEIKEVAGGTLLPVGISVVLILPLGLINFSREGVVKEGEAISSQGEIILIPDQSEYREQMDQINQKCGLERHLKQKAVDTFQTSRDLAQAKAYMKTYLELCPEDSEGQIYYNNYSALLINQSRLGTRPLLKLAAVTPLLRENGVKDSFQILRGISLAQHRTNHPEQEDQDTIPLLLVTIVNDSIPIGETDSDAEKNKAEKAILAAQAIVNYTPTDRKDQSFVGVIGHFGSGQLEAASQTYNLHNMPVISPTSTNLRETITANRYKFNGVSLMHRVLAITPTDFARTFATNYGLFRHLLDISVFSLWPIEPGRLDLDPNIFRMPPIDNDAQQQILNYLRDHNTNHADQQVEKIIVISENSNTSKYSENYLKSLKHLAQNSNGNGYQDVIFEPCRYKTGAGTFKDKVTCSSEIISKPSEKKALIIALSSNKLSDALRVIGDIIKKHPKRENLLVFGSDSLLSARDQISADPLFKGTVITSASRESLEVFPLPANPKTMKRITMTWRSQMAYDSVIVYRELLTKALRAHYRPYNVRGLRRYLIDHMTTGIKTQLSNREGLIQFEKNTHDRDVSFNSSMNLLLCISKHPQGGEIQFREIDLASQNPFCSYEP